jgi:hypothetical protein
MKTLNIILAFTFSLIATVSFAQPMLNSNNATMNTIGANGNQLKVENVNNGFSIKWQTASESNTARFELQISEDNQNFTKIKKVIASNNSEVATNYEATFNNTIILADTVYCRVKTVFADGSEMFTTAVVLNMNAAK